MFGRNEAIVQLLVPDAVLRLGSARVGLLAVAVAEARVDPQRDFAARRDAAVLVDHVGRTAVDVDVVRDDQLQYLRVEDVGRVHDRRRFALGPISGGQCAADLKSANRVDQGPGAT